MRRIAFVAQPAMIYIVFAHPYPSQSRTNRALLDAARSFPEVDVCSLYDRYPDFDIDIAAEQASLSRADLVIWMHPVYWHSVPGLLKHWFDKVLTYGWAHGEGGTALQGKDCLWVATTGGSDTAYSAAGIHQRPLVDFARPIEVTARFCGMRWQPPHILHGTNNFDASILSGHAQQFKQRLADWLASHSSDRNNVENES